MTPNDQTDSELIDDYLAGRLDILTRQQVEKRIRSDDAFRREVDLQRALHQQLKVYGQQQLRVQMQQWETEAAQEYAVVRPLWQQSAFYVAASIIIILVGAGLWFVNHPSVDSQAQQVAKTFRLPVSAKGLGFAGDTVYTDSVWVQILPATQEIGQYRFTDTLFIYTRQPSALNVDLIQLTQDTNRGRYKLRLNDTTIYWLERGFRQLRPLERSR